MTASVLIDTSAWIEALRVEGDVSTQREVRLVLQQGTAVFCDLVRLELWNGARGERDHAYLRRLERDLPCLPTTAEVWERSRELARSCRRAGVTIPNSDLLIGACALHHRARLLHRDRHFELLQQVSEQDPTT